MRENTKAIETVVRADWARILAALTKNLGDMSLAEDSLQDAVEAALRHWPRDGIPTNPPAWLMQSARRKAIDRLRRRKNFQAKEAEVTRLMREDAMDNEQNEAARANRHIPDNRLEMIFTCCHPALDEKSRIALTLRTIGGLATNEIASAFLDKKDAMAARLTRAKKKIAAAAIGYQVPEKENLPDRLNTVLAVVYLIFNEGYYASRSEGLLRNELAREAVRLGHLLSELMPDEPEVKGLLALMMLHDARKHARMDDLGRMIALEHQDRGKWDHEAIKNAIAILKPALARQKPGPYQLQAAISALHCEAPSWNETDWAQIAALYRALEALANSPVVTLNRIVAESRRSDVEGAAKTALGELERLADQLATYQPFHAAIADLARRSGERERAKIAYQMAISLSSSATEKTFLAKRMAELELH